MISQACCTKKLKDPLENVSTEVMDEVDLIFRNYVIIDPTKQALPGAILIEKQRMNYGQYKEFMLNEYFKFETDPKVTTNNQSRQQKIRSIRKSFKGRAIDEKKLTPIQYQPNSDQAGKIRLENMIFSKRTPNG